jgi:myo-inositol-1(or 4)-monophosphatase
MFHVKQLLETALEAAHSAGAVLLEKFAQPRQVTVKGYRDVVTDADTAAETTALAVIRAHFPDHAILSEEAGATDSGSPYVWMVDPLDGTTNYSRSHPTFAVSVAVTRDGEPLAGVVHDPLRGHTFAAQRGDGATCNGRPIHVAPTARLCDALIANDWAHADAEREILLRWLAALAPRCRTVRGMGVASLGLAYVAAGWLDLYFARGLFPWDVAAGSLLVAEAGGRITGPDGEPWRIGQPALLATNGMLHEETLRRISEKAP